jgi:uncharacterized protein (DUF2141 family)
LPSQRAPLAGTAVVAGTVVAAEDGKTPIRRVRVMLNSVDRSFGETAITGDDGGFRFTSLPAGRYTLAAMKPAYVRAQFGETRPGRVGTPIAVGDGQTLAGLTLPLTKGAVLGGTILDPTGEPGAGSVTVFRRSTTGGRWVEAGSGDLDDRGMFRVFGLRPGDYLVAVEPRTDLFGTRSLELPTGVRGSSRAVVGYSPVFYPGTAVESAAASITLTPGEERTNLDFSVQFVPMGEVKGTVVDPEGGETRDSIIFMINAAGLLFNGAHDAQGRAFHFHTVAPGEYLIGAAMRAGQADSKWASAKVSLTGGEALDVVLTLRASFTMTGRIVAEGASAPDKAMPTLRVKPLPGADRLLVGGFQEPPKADGSFVINGLAPGRYQLLAHDDSPETPWRWSLKSVLVNGVNVAHAPIDISGDIRDVVVTFTNRVTELSGTLQDASGRPASDYHIVVFPADRQGWLPGSARLQTVRPGTDGAYAVRGLPAGEYLIAALTDVEPDEWHDHAFLAQLVPAAITVRLSEGEKKTQDIRIAK